jgi:hypothetical protein
MEKEIISNSKNMLAKLNSNLQSIIDNTDGNLKNMLDNSYVMVAVRVFLGLYAAFAAPQLPKNLALLMDSTVIRVLFAALIVYSGLKDPLTALMIAIAFIVTLQTADKFKIYNTSESITSPQGISWLPSAKEGAVIGKELYENPEDLLKKRMIQSEMAREKVIEKEMAKNSDVIDNEMMRQSNHHILESKIADIKSFVPPKKIVLHKPVIVKNNLTDITRNIGQGLINLGSNIGSGVVDSVANVGEGAYNTANTLVGSAIGTTSELGQGVVGTAAAINNSVALGAVDLGSGLKGGVKQIAGGVIGGVRSVGTGVVGGVKNVKTGVVGGVSTLGDCVINSASQIGSGLLNGVKELTDGLVDGVSQMGSGAIGGVHQLGQGVIASASDLGLGAHASANQLSRGVLSGTHHLGQGVVGGVRQLGSGIRSGVQSLAQPIYLAEHMTDVPKSSTTCNFMPYTSPEQFGDASENVVPGANLNSVVKTFNSQYNAQGMLSNYVNGYGGNGFANY